MTPLLTGVFASQISGHLTPPFTPTGSYDALATYTVPSGGASTITFSGLPTGGQYKHLQLRISGLAGADDSWMQINNSLNAVQANQFYGTGSVASAGAPTGYGYIDAGATSTSAPAVYIIDILDYADTSKNKTVRDLWGYDYNGSGRLGVDSFLYTTTDAINSITIANRTWSQHSQFSLYGVKG